MNFTQIETFIKVYEAKSFSKVAEENYITHTAIIQQINLLEDNLEVKLFKRTNRGVTPTMEGEYFYPQAKELVAKWNMITHDLHQMNNPQSFIYVSDFQNSLLTPFLNEYLEKNHLEKIVIHKTIMNNTSNEQVEFDVLEAMEYNFPYLQVMNFLELFNVPIAIAVAKDHPLASKDKVTINDLIPYKVVTIKRGLITAVNKLNFDLKRAGVDLVEIDRYSEEEMKEYLSKNYIFQIPQSWELNYPELKFLCGDWNYSIPYGYYYKDDAEEKVLNFIDYASTYLRKEHS